MNSDLLFESNEEKKATENVLAAFKVKSLNGEIDNLIAEVFRYAKRIDDILEENGYKRKYLDKISSLNENATISLESDLESLDFRVKEVVEDLIKRINTRIKLVYENNSELKNIEQKYDVNSINLIEEIKKAKLTMDDFA